MMRALARFFRCSHETYRERREVNGVPVQHFVCRWCLQAWPVVDRTPAEHAEIVAAGQIQPARVWRSGKVRRVG